jgi:glucose-1-phosphatase
MQKKYSVIVFDLGNVLLPFDYNILIGKLNEIENNLGENFMEYYENNYNLHRSFEKGEISEEDFIERMLKVLGNRIDKEKFCNYFSEIFKVNEDVISLLPKLKKNYTIVLLSNTNSIHEKYGWKHYEFLKYFDKLFLSHEIGAYKPEEKIYKAVENFTKKPPSEHIFIDDVPEYVEGAKKMGWDAVKFRSYEKLLDDLKEREII